MDAITHVPAPINEPALDYAHGSPERARLEQRLKELASEQLDLTATIGGEQRFGGGAETAVVQPHRHAHVLGVLRNTTRNDAADAIRASGDAAASWRALSFDDRASIFLKAADLLAGPWRDTLNAATMLGQSKTVFQAEIDSACELIDFWRFNVHIARRSSPSSRPPTAPASGTGWTIARWRDSSTRSRRSTSPRSRATCRPRRP
jgi:1-pyrroline-5-carboxylate dehydrogenase